MQNLGLSGSGRTCNQAVRPMHFFVQIQIYNLVFALHTQRCRHAFVNRRFTPSLLKVQILHRINMQQLKQRNVLCQIVFQTDFFAINRRKLHNDPLGRFGSNGCKRKRLPLICIFREYTRAHVRIVECDHFPTAWWYQFTTACKKHKRHANARRFVKKFRQRM